MKNVQQVCSRLIKSRRSRGGWLTAGYNQFSNVTTMLSGCLAQLVNSSLSEVTVVDELLW